MLFTLDQVVALKWFPNATMFLYDLVKGGNDKSHIFALFSAPIIEASNVTTCCNHPGRLGNVGFPKSTSRFMNLYLLQGTYLSPSQSNPYELVIINIKTCKNMNKDFQFQLGMGLVFGMG
jgi:hypothetical protein